MFKSLRRSSLSVTLRWFWISMLVLGVYLIKALDHYFIDNLRGQAFS
jgi:hypothetical protein